MNRVRTYYNQKGIYNDDRNSFAQGYALSAIVHARHCVIYTLSLSLSQCTLLPNTSQLKTKIDKALHLYSTLPVWGHFENVRTCWIMLLLKREAVWNWERVRVFPLNTSWHCDIPRFWSLSHLTVSQWVGGDFDSFHVISYHFLFRSYQGSPESCLHSDSRSERCLSSNCHQLQSGNCLNDHLVRNIEHIPFLSHLHILQPQLDQRIFAQDLLTKNWNYWQCPCESNSRRLSAHQFILSICLYLYILHTHIDLSIYLYVYE